MEHAVHVRVREGDKVLFLLLVRVARRWCVLLEAFLLVPPLLRSFLKLDELVSPRCRHRQRTRLFLVFFLFQFFFFSNRNKKSNGKMANIPYSKVLKGNGSLSIAWRMSARAALSPRSSPSLLVALFLPLLSFPAFAQLSNKRLSLSLSPRIVRCLVYRDCDPHRTNSNKRYIYHRYFPQRGYRIKPTNNQKKSLQRYSKASRSFISPSTVFSGLRPTQ
jgi:hypothetical protein